MRSVRAAVHAALPVLGLAALGVTSALRGTPPAPLLQAAAHQGGGTVTVRIVTDGHPRLITLPGPPRRQPPVLPPAAAVTRTVTRAVARTAAPRPLPAARTAPTAVPEQTTTAADGYPYGTDTTAGTDEWGFTKRQCVSYVAWRLSSLGRPIDNASQGWGSALDWDDTARRLGYAVGSQPRVGTVAQWNADERSTYWSPGATSANGTYAAGPVGHVAWVTKVYSDGSVLVAQYNGTGDRTYSTMHVSAPRYLSL